MCSPNACKYVFNPNVTIFQSNCAEDLHYVIIAVIIIILFCNNNHTGRHNNCLVQNYNKHWYTGILIVLMYLLLFIHLFIIHLVIYCFVVYFIVIIIF